MFWLFSIVHWLTVSKAASLSPQPGRLHSSPSRLHSLTMRDTDTTDVIKWLCLIQTVMFTHNVCQIKALGTITASDTQMVAGQIVAVDCVSTTSHKSHKAKKWQLWGMKNNFVNEGSLCNFCALEKKKKPFGVLLLSGYALAIIGLPVISWPKWRMLATCGRSSVLTGPPLPIHCGRDSGRLLSVTRPSLHLCAACQIMVDLFSGRSA